MQKFSVTIERSKRKTVSLKVTRTGEVVVKAPYRTSQEFLNSFLEKNSGWIERQIAARQTAQLDLSDGAPLKLFGNCYLVATGQATFDREFVFLPPNNRETALIKLLKEEALKKMELLTERYAKIHGFSYTAVKVSSAHGRWGSCNKKGGIGYSFRIAFLPENLIEYIVVHELAHTVHFNHSTLFWQTVENILPDWRTSRKKLKSYGYVMNFL